MGACICLLPVLCLQHVCVQDCGLCPCGFFVSAFVCRQQRRGTECVSLSSIPSHYPSAGSPPPDALHLLPSPHSRCYSRPASLLRRERRRLQPPAPWLPPPPSRSLPPQLLSWMGRCWQSPRGGPDGIDVGEKSLLEDFTKTHTRPLFLPHPRCNAPPAPSVCLLKHFTKSSSPPPPIAVAVSASIIPSWDLQLLRQAPPICSPHPSQKILKMQS